MSPVLSLLSRMTKFERQLGESMRGERFTHKAWKQLAKNWTHDHCRMCNAQLREYPLEGDYSEGYVTYTPTGDQPPSFSEHGYTFVPSPKEREGSAPWICPPCFAKYREHFDWKAKDEHNQGP
jgi:hypothetical protein